MNRLVHTLECDLGYLVEVETYTNDITQAVTFTEFETAHQKLMEVNKLLKNECWIGLGYLPFPRPNSLLEGCVNG